MTTIDNTLLILDNNEGNRIFLKIKDNRRRSEADERSEEAERP
jgi:hypothetical protein